MSRRGAMQVRIRRAALACALGAVLFGAPSPRAAAEQAERGQIEVDAELVELDQERGEASFRGSVRLRHDSLRLSCDRLTARIDGDGRLSSIDAAGNVSIRAAGVEAQAGIASYSPSTRRLLLRSRPQVRSAAGVLRGRQIVVELATGRVSIEEVQGVFQIR
jgi:lipopolysaccharide transport protein LptA